MCVDMKEFSVLIFDRYFTQILNYALHHDVFQGYNTQHNAELCKFPNRHLPVPFLFFYILFFLLCGVLIVKCKIWQHKKINYVDISIINIQ